MEQQWTAISRPPYFSALVAWSVPVQFENGGVFDANDSVRLYGVQAESPILTGHLPTPLKVRYGESVGSVVQQVDEFKRRSGHRIHLAEHRRWEDDPNATSFQTEIESKRGPSNTHASLTWLRLPIEPLLEEIQSKDLERSRAVILAKQGIDFGLRNLASAPTPHTIILAHELTRMQYILRGVDWANLDQKGRVVFTRGGVVYACHANSSGEPMVTALADFSADRFESIAPPDSAMRW